jgi:hypothetical protein
MRRLATIAAVLLLALPAQVAVADSYLAIDYQVPLILKLLTYENTLMSLHEQTIEMGILYRPRDSESKRAFEQFRKEMSLYSDRTIHDRRLILVPLGVAQADSVGTIIRRSGVDVVYVGPGFEGDLGAIKVATRRGKVLSVTGVPAYVEQGLCVAAVRRGDQAGITLNLEASREEGRDWNASLLQLCRIIR